MKHIFSAIFYSHPIKRIILCCLLLSTLNARNLKVLETFQDNKPGEFSKMFSAFACNLDASGALWVHYSLTCDASWPQYLVSRYQPGQTPQRSELGAYYGIGGYYDPVICRVTNTTMESQVFVSNDYGREKQYHELVSLNFAGKAFKKEQYPGGVSNTSLLHVRKITENTGSSFSMDWDANGDPVSVKFLNNFQLYDIWPDDYSGPFLETDTLWESKTPATFVYDERIPNTNYMAALFRHWEDTQWRFVCVDNEEVLFESSDILSTRIKDVKIKTTEEGFIIFWRAENTNDLYYKEYKPQQAKLSSEKNFYSPEVGSLGYFELAEMAIDEENVYLQFPMLKTAGKTSAGNWSSIIRQTIRRDDFSILQSDTLISFSERYRYLNHRITAHDGQAHSLIVTNTGNKSQLLYAGPLLLGRD